MVQVLASALDRPVQAFEPPVDCPKELPAGRYAANLGLYLAGHAKRQGRSKDSSLMNAALNILPERHRPRPLPVLPAAVFAGLLLLGFLAVNVTGWVSDISGEIGTLKSTLDLREDQAREYRLAVARTGVMVTRIAEAELESEALTAVLDSRSLAMDTLLARLDAIFALAAEANVDLTRMVPQSEGFSIVGTSEGYADVLAYAASLRSSAWFEGATVLQVADAAGVDLSFTVLASVPQPVLEEESEGLPSP